MKVAHRTRIGRHNLQNLTRGHVRQRLFGAQDRQRAVEPPRVDFLVGGRWLQHEVGASIERFYDAAALRSAAIAGGNGRLGPSIGAPFSTAHCLIASIRLAVKGCVRKNSTDANFDSRCSPGRRESKSNRSIAPPTCPYSA